MDVVTAPTPVTLGAQPSGQPALQPGAVINALVLRLLDQGQVRLAVANTLIDVMTQVPLAPGTTVRLAVEGTPAELRLVMVDQSRNAGVRADAAVRPAAVTGGETQVRELRAPIPGAEPGPVAPTEGKAQAPSVAALTQAVQSAAARQNGLSPLLADVAAAADLDLLPEPVRQAANQLLALRTPLRSDLTATDLKQAFARSGLLMEARLATGAAQPAEPVPDLKAALGVLRQALATWFDTAAPAVQPNTAPPPNQAAAPTPGEAVKGQAVKGEAAKGEAVKGAAVKGDAAPTPSRAGMPPQASVAKAPIHIAVPSGFPEEVPEAALPRHPERAAAVGRAAIDNSLETAPRPRGSVPMPGLVPSPGLPALRAGLPVIALGEARVPGQAPETQTAPPPPYRGAPPAAQPAVAPSMMLLADPHVVAETLLSETDAALARQTLLQAASLPERADTQPQRPEATGPRWNFEIPFATPHGTAIAQFEIARDGHQAPAEGASRAWRVRFTLDVEPMGPVHAQISLKGVRASVNLWAERGTSAAQLRQHAALLREALKEAEFEPGDVVVRNGMPPQAQAAAGRFLDRAS